MRRLISQRFNRDLIEIGKENKPITSQLKGLLFAYGSFTSNGRLYGNDTQFSYGIFKNVNGKYILGYYRSRLRGISGMVEFDSLIDFLGTMRAMKIKEPIKRIAALVSDDGQD